MHCAACESDFSSWKNEVGETHCVQPCVRAGIYVLPVGQLEV